MYVRLDRPVKKKRGLVKLSHLNLKLKYFVEVCLNKVVSIYCILLVLLVFVFLSSFLM